MGIVVLVVLSMLISPVRRSAGRNAKQLCMLVVTVAVMLSVVEGVMRKTEFREGKPPHKYLHAVNIHREYMPSPSIMPGISGKAIFKNNSQGLRGTEIPARDKAYRILCVGGSTTECLYLDQSETWTTLLAGDLAAKLPSKPVWSAGAGMSGTDAAQHLELLKEAAIINEMNCVVLLAGVNDMAKELNRTHKSLFAGRRTRVHNQAAQAKEEAEQEDREAKGAWWAHLAMFRRIETAVQKAGQTEPLMAEDVLGRRYEARRQARMDAAKESEAPDLTGALTDYASRLQAIVDTLRAKRIRPVLVTQPVLWKKEGNPPEEERLFWFGLVPGEPIKFLSTPKLRESMDRYNDVMKHVAAKNQVEVVDLSPMSGKKENFADDCHFSEAGALEVSRRVADVISQKGW